MLSGSEFILSIGDISFFEAFSMRRSSRDRARDKFAYASRFTLGYGTGRMTITKSVAPARQNAEEKSYQTTTTFFLSEPGFAGFRDGLMICPEL
jgi:hypothetical protein